MLGPRSRKLLLELTGRKVPRPTGVRPRGSARTDTTTVRTGDDRFCLLEL